jgi:hypothetical protein
VIHFRALVLVLAGCLMAPALARGGAVEQSCPSTWVEHDFVINGTVNGRLEQAARVEAVLTNAEGRPEEGGAYLRVHHQSGGTAPFFFAVGKTFHTLKPGQKKTLLVQEDWRYNKDRAVLMKAAFCRPSTN